MSNERMRFLSWLLISIIVAYVVGFLGLMVWQSL